MAWGKAGSDTLTTAGDTLTTGTITASTFNQLMSYQIQTGGAAGAELSFNSDSGSNYTRRWSVNGTTDSTDTSQTKTNYYYNGDYPVFSVTYFINISSEEKLFIGNFLSQNASGAGNAPRRVEIVNKWTNTSEQITTVTMNNTLSGDFAIDSNLTALGSDITPAAAIPFASDVTPYTRAEITDTRKMYSLRPNYVTLTDDFSSSSGYTFATGNSISGGELTAKPAGSLGFTKALGFTMDNEKWVMRIHGYTLQSGFSWSSSMSSMFGFSDQSGLVAYNGAGNNFGFNIHPRTTAGYTINNVRSKLNGSMSGGGNGTVGERATDLVVGTKYYIECKRTSATSGELRIYSDSDFTTLYTTAYVSDATMNASTGLNYFSLQGQTNGGTHVVKIDKIVIYNGVTVAEEGEWKEIGSN